MKKVYRKVYRFIKPFKQYMLLKKIKCNNKQYLLITNLYPSKDNIYQNAFIHTKVKAYKESGIQIEIFKVSSSPYIFRYKYENINIYTMDYETLLYIFKNCQYKVIMVHFLNNIVWDILLKNEDVSKIFIWAHGYEIQSWERRKHNFITSLEQNKARDASRKNQFFWKGVIRNLNKNIKIVFVSQYLVDSVMEDLNYKINENHYYVIHNFINTKLFSNILKPIEQRKKILSIRPYANANYANDLTIKAIIELSKQPYFNELEFKLIGNGVLFDSTVEPVRKFKNVSIEKKFLSQKEIANLHKDYGIFLCPTRMDTQGVSRDEAMSSGLVPITNNIAAIPEFVDKNCAILADKNDYIGLAKGISMMYENPTLYQSMSNEAASRVRRQSAFKYTIARELDLFYED